MQVCRDQQEASNIQSVSILVCRKCMKLTEDGACRGIPSGYISALEQRLNDTEIALHEALSELGNLRRIVPHAEQPRQPCLPLTRVAQLSKASRMAEWKQYPLNSPQDIERWWQALRTAYSIEGSDCECLSSSECG
jgi:hypothetical protein